MEIQQLPYCLKNGYRGDQLDIRSCEYAGSDVCTRDCGVYLRGGMDEEDLDTDPGDYDEDEEDIELWEEEMLLLLDEEDEEDE